MRGRDLVADPERARWLLWRLRRCFPHALAACLMPDHLHVVTPVRCAKAVVRRLGSVLSGYSRHLGGGQSWQRVAPPKVLSDDKHLLRNIRYVHLNPCRDGLCRDPLQWPFSTHRGAVGAELDPWVSPERLGAWFGRSADQVPDWIHGYVSADPTVAVAGTPLPHPALPCAIARVPLADLIAAVRAATPWSSTTQKRQVFTTLADNMGWRDVGYNAQAIGVHPDTIRRLRRAPASSRALAPALLCLGDARLRV
ncbi:MAG TPA: hypothetical protein PKA88_35345 [Polyangiaceae bacterium]|nr:hypothetical protein [Polyangiaceae bacterium]